MPRLSPQDYSTTPLPPSPTLRGTTPAGIKGVTPGLTQDELNQLWASSQGMPVPEGQATAQTGELYNKAAANPTWLQKQLAGQGVTVPGPTGTIDPAAGAGGGGSKGPQKTQPQPPDALTQGIGMFFSQYLAPLMYATNQSNMQQIGQWGGQMNQALKGLQGTNLPNLQQFTQAMNAAVPYQQMELGMMNNAAFQTATQSPQMQQFMQNLQQNTAAQQAAQDIAEKAVTTYTLQTGNAPALQALQNLPGVKGSTLGTLLQVLAGQGGGVTGLPGVPGTSATNTPAAATSAAPQTTAQSLFPATTPNVTPTTDAATLANMMAAAGYTGTTPGYTPTGG